MSGSVPPAQPEVAVAVGVAVVVPAAATAASTAASEDAVPAPAAAAPAPADAAPATTMPAMPPQSRMRDTLVRSAARDVKRFAWLLMAGATCLATYHAVLARYFDPRDFYAYQGSSGPYEVLSDDQGHTDPGPPLTFARPGQRFGWLVSLCTAEGASVLANLDLVRVASPAFPEQSVAHRQTVFSPVSKRCGPSFITWSIPDGTLPGQYEVRRQLVARFDSHFPVARSLPTLHLSVLAAPAQSSPPPSDAKPSAYRIDL